MKNWQKLQLRNFYIRLMLKKSLNVPLQFLFNMWILNFSKTSFFKISFYFLAKFFAQFLQVALRFLSSLPQVFYIFSISLKFTWSFPKIFIEITYNIFRICSKFILSSYKNFVLSLENILKTQRNLINFSYFWNFLELIRNFLRIFSKLFNFYR